MSEVRFSPQALIEKKFGKAEKNVKTARVTKRIKKNSKSKYIIKYDSEGVKHMILR